MKLCCKGQCFSSLLSRRHPLEHVTSLLVFIIMAGYYKLELMSLMSDVSCQLSVVSCKLSVM